MRSEEGSLGGHCRVQHTTCPQCDEQPRGSSQPVCCGLHGALNTSGRQAHKGARQGIPFWHTHQSLLLLVLWSYHMPFQPLSSKIIAAYISPVLPSFLFQFVQPLYCVPDRIHCPFFFSKPSHTLAFDGCNALICNVCACGHTCIVLPWRVPWYASIVRDDTPLWHNARSAREHIRCDECGDLCCERDTDRVLRHSDGATTRCEALCDGDLTGVTELETSFSCTMGRGMMISLSPYPPIPPS